MCCSPPCCLDLSLVRPSERGLCRAELAPDSTPLRLMARTDWTVRLLEPGGGPVDGARVTAGGGMPQLGLGFAPAPAVSALGAGRHRITGLRFTAPGWWILRLSIETAGGSDAVTFNLVL
jgi:hypothetical protein